MASNFRPLKKPTTPYGGRRKQIFGRFRLLSPRRSATTTANAVAPDPTSFKTPITHYDHAGRRQQILANTRTLARFTEPRLPENKIKFQNHEVIVAHSVEEGFTARVIGYDDDDEKFKTLYEDSDDDYASAIERLFLNVAGDVERFLGKVRTE